MTEDLRELLASVVGEWSGHYRLWLEPGKLHAESGTTATVTPVLDGRFVRIAYDWTVDDALQRGEFLLAAPEGKHLTASWIDTWHSGGDILLCPSDGAATVIAEYGPTDEPWRWRTGFELRDDGSFVITAWNITPAGEEGLATEAIYRR